MKTIDQPRNLSCRDYQQRCLIVTTPRPHDGVRNALVGSFAPLPAIPAELAALLARIG